VDVIIDFVILALQLYMWVIIARALLSWFPQRYGTPLYKVNRVLVAATEPYVGLFRRYLPLGRFGSVGLDLSPLVALFVLFIVIRLLLRL
jgi:YggT family protein